MVAAKDFFPVIDKYKSIFVFILCLFMYSLGLIYCTQAGIYWIDIMDNFATGWAILIIGALECICIGWFYGHRRFYKDISIMIGSWFNKRWIHVYFTVCWRFLSPFLLIVATVFTLIDFKPLTTGSYKFPLWVKIK